MIQPERISGQSYTVQADVWALGLTLIELAIGHFPFPSGLAMFELLQMLVVEPAPRLPEDQFSPEFVNFVDYW